MCLCSQISVFLDLSSYFPVEQPIQVVEHQVLVVFDHCVCFCDTEVYSGPVDQFLALFSFSLVIVLRSTSEQEMLLKAFDCFLDDFFLVVKQTELKESISLSWLVSLLICNGQQLFQMLNGFLYIFVLGVSLSQLSMSLSLFRRHFCFFWDLQEFAQILDRFRQVTLSLINVAYFLVAFCFLWSVLGSLRCLQTFLEILQCFLKIFVFFLLLESNGLIHSDKFFTNFLFELIKTSFFGFLKGSY